MSYYTVTVKEIQVIGGIWWPYGLTCAQVKTLSDHDINNIKERGNGEITREACEQWLMLHSGDFSSIDDFRVDIADFISEWENPDSESIFYDCMYPE